MEKHLIIKEVIQTQFRIMQTNGGNPACHLSDMTESKTLKSAHSGNLSTFHYKNESSRRSIPD